MPSSALTHRLCKGQRRIRAQWHSHWGSAFTASPSQHLWVAVLPLPFARVLVNGSFTTHYTFMLSFIMFLKSRTQKAALNMSWQMLFPSHHLQLHPLRCILSEFIFKLLSTGYIGIWCWVLPEIRENLGVSMNHWPLLKVKTESIQRGEKKSLGKVPFLYLQPWRYQHY